ncbi:MAG: HD domain-containing protein [Longimicrobiales bacterium]|nr:HD domain-containing protein [Longimicrobiales bacterium]
MHPVIEHAADGRLPEWAEATPERRDHMVRVADVMEGWAVELGLDREQRRRWRAVAMLHDALRDADPGRLRERVPEFDDLPDGLLHGPAAAARLESEGVDDRALLSAVRWHTLGHPELDRLGRALYIADFTEPGRSHQNARLASLRERVPTELQAVLLEVTAERVGLNLADRYPLREPAVGFWNVLVEEAADG